MRCVNDTLPPRPRLRWLLMTMRLSTSSLAGMARTLVAVGTDRLADMLAAVLAAVPRSRTSVPPAARDPAGAGAAGGAFGAVGWAGAAVAGPGAAAGAGAGAGPAVGGRAGAGRAGALSPAGAAWAASAGC